MTHYNMILDIKENIYWSGGYGRKKGIWTKTSCSFICPQFLCGSIEIYASFSGSYRLLFKEVAIKEYIIGVLGLEKG